MRVLFVSTDDFRGPTTKQLHHFAATLARRGHECLILLNGDPRSLEELGRPAEERLRLARYSFVGPRLVPRVSRIVREFGADVVHCYEPRVASFAAAGQAARESNSPLCVHFADDDIALFQAAGSTQLRRAARPLLRQAARLQPNLWPMWDPRLDRRLSEAASAFDALTPALAGFVERRFNRPCRVILPPVPERPVEGPPDESLLREAHVDGVPYILYAGAVYRAHEDDFALLISAFGRLVDIWPTLLLVHTGHVSPRIDIDALAERAGVTGRIRRLGYLPRQDDVFSLMRGAAVLVQPGAPTPFNRHRLPSKLPEYLLSGRPVVTFAAGAGELLDDGVDALMTRTADPAELAGQIDRVLRDPELARRLGASGRARALALFSVERNCDALIEMYDEVVGSYVRRAA